MDADTLFSFSGPLAMIGWLVLAFSPLIPGVAQKISGLIIPAILSLAYIVFIIIGWAGAPGGFDSLANVMLLFDTPMVALAGWVHYLAFDLFIGAWEVRTARREGISHFLVLPCLFLTFMFGPAGLVLFLTIRLARSYVQSKPAEA